MANIYVMDCMIKIDALLLKNCSSVKIESSIKSLSDTATLVIPRNIAKLNAKKSILEIIKIDSKIEIHLGYNGEVIKEFEGYIKNISSNEPLELECEDEMYILRKKELKAKHYPKVKLSTLLHDMLSEYKLVFDYDFEMLKYNIPSGKSVFDVLMHLKESFPVDFFFRRNEKTKVLELHSGWTYSFNPKAYKTYHLEKNTVKNDLKYIVGTAKKIKVKTTATLSNGKKITAEWGDADAKTETIKIEHVTDVHKLEIMAKSLADEKRYTGFSGKITGFGFPRTLCGEGLEIISDKYPDRNGKYLIDKVTIDFSESGYRRENEISKKITVSQ
jgi:hypothetical protein